MTWSDDISLEDYYRKKIEWYSDPQHFIGDPPIDAQYALNLIFKTLIDDRDNCSYLTTIPESSKQINCIMLDIILQRYSHKYRKFMKNMKRKKHMAEDISQSKSVQPPKPPNRGSNVQPAKQQGSINYVNLDDVIDIVTKIMCDNKIGHKGRAMHRNIKQLPITQIIVNNEETE